MTKQPKGLVSAEMLESIVNRENPLFALVTDLEAPILELENRSRIMFRITGDMDDGDGMAVYQLACDVDAAAARLSKIHGELFRMTHPNPAKVAEFQKLMGAKN